MALTKRNLNIPIIMLGILLTALAIFAATRTFLMPLSAKVFWGGSSTPAHAAGWNILALASMFGGFTFIEFFPRNGRAYRAVFYTTIMCAVLCMIVTVWSMVTTQ